MRKVQEAVFLKRGGPDPPCREKQAEETPWSGIEAAARKIRQQLSTLLLKNGCEKMKKSRGIVLQKAYICSFSLHKIKLIVSENDL